MRLEGLRAVLLAAAACSGGCALPGGHPNAGGEAVPVHPEPASSPIAPSLEMMSTLQQGDPAKQAEAFQTAKDAVDLTPTTSNKLRYALALATPGHSSTDPVAAQRQLSDLLARPETLLPIERLLAMVELKEVEQQLILQAENKRLRDEASHDSRDKLQAVNRRLTAEVDENARLRKALDEARAKLDAVTHIEGSIHDHDASAPYKP
jgi:hypothetical protein